LPCLDQIADAEETIKKIDAELVDLNRTAANIPKMRSFDDLTVRILLPSISLYPSPLPLLPSIDSLPPTSVSIRHQPALPAPDSTPPLNFASDHVLSRLFNDSLQLNLLYCTLITVYLHSDWRSTSAFRFHPSSRPHALDYKTQHPLSLFRIFPIIRYPSSHPPTDRLSPSIPLLVPFFPVFLSPPRPPFLSPRPKTDARVLRRHPRNGADRRDHGLQGKVLRPRLQGEGSWFPSPPLPCSLASFSLPSLFESVRRADMCVILCALCGSSGTSTCSKRLALPSVVEIFALWWCRGTDGKEVGRGKRRSLLGDWNCR
jgi:hypothetical protein